MGFKSIDKKVVVHDLKNLVQKLQQNYTSGKTTANALTSNKELLSNALNNYNLVDANTAFLEILHNGESTLEAIREFLTVIQDCEFREKLSELLNELIKSKSENVKRIIIKKLQNTKQKLINGTAKIMAVVTTVFETYILQCIWEELQNADLLAKNQEEEIKSIQQEIEKMEDDVEKLSNAMSRYAEEKNENKKKKYDEIFFNRAVSQRYLCVKVKQDLGDLKLITGEKINDLRAEILIPPDGVCSAAAGIITAYCTFQGCFIMTDNLNDQKKAFMELLEMLERFGEELDEFYAIVKDEEDLEAKKLENCLDL